MEQWKVIFRSSLDAKDHGDQNGDNMNSANSKDKEESMNSASKKFDPLSYNGGPITRVRAKKMKEAIMGLILHHLEPMLKSQRSRSTHGQPQSKPNSCAHDPSYIWAEFLSLIGVYNSAIGRIIQSILG